MPPGGPAQPKNSGGWPAAPVLGCLARHHPKTPHLWGPQVWLCAGKYSVGAGDDTALPEGPRGQLFRQILPESRDLRSLLRDIATSRGVSESQVRLPLSPTGCAEVEMHLRGCACMCATLLAAIGRGQPLCAILASYTSDQRERSNCMHALLA